MWKLVLALLYGVAVSALVYLYIDPIMSAWADLPTTPHPWRYAFEIGSIAALAAFFWNRAYVIALAFAAINIGIVLLVGVVEPHVMAYGVGVAVPAFIPFLAYLAVGRNSKRTPSKVFGQKDGRLQY